MVMVVVLLLLFRILSLANATEERGETEIIRTRRALPGRVLRHQTRRALMLLQNASDRPNDGERTSGL